jgi:histidine triad (HIT) family protein
MTDCIFCKIANKEIPTHVVYENEQVMVFNDINPVADIHLLVIPKHHVAGICDPELASESGVPQALFAAVQTVATKLGLADNGFRVVVNYGADAGEAVSHLHLHIIAGRKLAWPPG